MDYNNSQMAITPCQLGIIHSKFSKENSLQRKLLVKDWCHLDTSSVINIYDTQEWNGSKDLNYSIRIHEGGSLAINCRIAMPKDGKITVDPGAKLILQGAKIHNDCGQQWKGIEIKNLGDLSGQVIY